MDIQSGIKTGKRECHEPVSISFSFDHFRYSTGSSKFYPVDRSLMTGFSHPKNSSVFKKSTRNNPAG